ncbi:MAG: hypothetical protein ABIH59_01810 [archaeon]
MYLSAIRKEEYKVNYDFFVDDLKSAGFKIVKEIKIWPKEDLFEDPKMGDFVFVIKKI